MSQFRWTISQIGARQHFGVPRGFLYKNNLRRLYTEAWCRWGHSLLRKGPRNIRAFATRYHKDIDAAKVVSFNTRTFWDQFTHPPKKYNTVELQFENHARIGEWFSKAVTKDLAQRELDPERDVFFGFDTGCLETLELMRDRGCMTIVDQIDPGKVEEDLVLAEAEKWPGWEAVPGRIPQLYWDRLRKEWDLASLVLVNSKWSKDALIKQGVPAEKMFIVPVAYEAAKTHAATRNNFTGSITVLWVGTVILRKGIQYLVDAARMVQGNTKIKFVIAGPVQISKEAVANAPANMSFLGRITRDQTEDLYRKADIFVLPTVSDGFAITQVEAMAQAMPVITTPNCGEVVTEGVDGFIVPAGDAKGIADAILKLESNRKLLREMSYHALDKSAQFYLPRQAQMVEDAVRGYRAGTLNAPAKEMMSAK